MMVIAIRTALVPEVHCKSWTASMSTVQKSSCSPALAMNFRHP